MTSLISRILLSLWAVLFLTGISLYTLYPGDDPYRCRPLLETGQWIDPVHNETHRPWDHWQPDGCMLNKYTSVDMRRCFEGRSILMTGDSLNRQIAYGLGRILEREEADWDMAHVGNDVQLLHYHGMDIRTVWNPWLLTSPDPERDMLYSQLDLFREEVGEPPASARKQKGPALVLLGGGAWFAFGKNESDKQTRHNNFVSSIANFSNMVGWDMKNFYTAPMTDDGIGNQVFFAPPNKPSYWGDNPVILQNRSEGRVEVEYLQNMLHNIEDDFNFSFAWSMPATSDFDNQTIRDPLTNGFHVKTQIAETKAQIYLNLRCNAKLDRLNKWPYRRTCCTDYGGKPMTQQAFMYVGLVFLIVCLGCEMLDFACRNPKPRFQVLNMSVGGAFVLPLLMSYYADRTQMMAKGDRIWYPLSFAILFFPWILAGVFSICHKPPTHRPGPDTTQVAESNEAILCRDQSDEWKGWMMLALVTYRWLGGHQSTSMSIFARLLASAFIFQSGYGHASYFLVKKNYSFSRVATVFLRLNLLTVTLCFITNSDYGEYSFVNLANFWFLVVWAVLGFGHRRYNQDTQMILSKIAMSAVLVTFVFQFTPATGWMFSFLRVFVNSRWSQNIWETRLRNDLYMTYVGMIAAVAKQRCTVTLTHPLRFSLMTISALLLGAFWHTGYQTKITMDGYLPWHPFVSPIPILAYLVLRNAWPPSRNYHSVILAWAGRFSLELYILQFHLFQAADGEGVLLTGLFGPDYGTLVSRCKDLVLIAPIFFWIASCASSATSEIVRAVISQASHDDTLDYIPLSADGEKEDEDVIVDGLDKVSFELSSGLLADLRSSLGASLRMRPRSLPSVKSLLLSLQGRIIVLMIAIWALNLLTPGPSGYVPDGFTPRRVGKPFHPNMTSGYNETLSQSDALGHNETLSHNVTLPQI